MRRWLTAVTVTALLAAAAAPALPAAAAPSEAKARGYVVVLRDGRDSNRVAAAHARRYGADVSHVYGAALTGYAARIPDHRLSDLRADPDVAFISEDLPVSAVAAAPPQTVPTGVNRIDAEPLGGTADAGSLPVAVAVIDTGSGPHSDLYIAGGHNCTGGSTRNYADGNGHGTHVAGTIGAKHNTVGVVGVLPGVKIYSVRVLNSAGSGSWSSVICGIDWVTANAAGTPKNIRVANMSLGGAGSDGGGCGVATEDAMHKAICSSVAAGVTYVAAAGNDNVDLAGFVPAAYDEVLTVTAAADFNGQPGPVVAAATCRTDVDDTAADFSNWATVGGVDANHVIAAPGVCINSTWKGGGYKTISGTSMASPHVAGAVARCLTATVPACTGSPFQIAQDLTANRAFAYGFEGDPGHTTIGNRLYGYLLYAGGY